MSAPAGVLAELEELRQAVGEDPDSYFAVRKIIAKVTDVLDAADHLTAVIGFRIDDPRAYRLDALKRVVAVARGEA